MKKRSGKFANFNDYLLSGSWKKNADETKKICLLDDRAALDSYHNTRISKKSLRLFLSPSQRRYRLNFLAQSRDTGQIRVVTDPTTMKPPKRLFRIITLGYEI